MTYYGPDQVEQVKARTDLVAVFDRLLDRTARREGPHHKCCCPFHAEKTPSLVLYDDGHWHCYGCGAHGDAVEAVQRAKGVSFQDAVALLADMAGMRLEDLKPVDRPGDDQRPGLLAAVEFATAHYEAALWSDAGAPARDYLVQRGFSEQTLRTARAGWCDGRLHGAAEAAGISWSTLLTADLGKEVDGKRRDRFWQRIALPILDGQGRPVAFSCRLLPETEQRFKAEGKAVGKYVNSTETPIFKKGDAIYGLSKARSAVRDRHRLILVEGALDVLACQQAGFSEAVACLGTAVTARQAEMLHAATLHGKAPVILAQDSDLAGLKARLDTAQHLLAIGCPFRVTVPTTQAKDPADLLLGEHAADGLSIWNKTLEGAVPGTEWYIHTLIPHPDQIDAPQRMAFLDEICVLIRANPDQASRHLVIDRASKRLGIDRNVARKRAKALDAPTDGSTASRIPLTDYGNALRWMHHARLDVLFCKEWHCFVLWDGKRWVVDDSGGLDTLAWDSYHRAMDAALASEIAAAKACGDSDRLGRLRSWRESSDATQSHRNALEHAKRLMVWQVKAKEFDADPWLLGVRNGTLDLRTGVLLPPDRGHRITRVCEADWQGDIHDARFDAFVAHMFSTTDVLRYVQRFFGYCLTGITTEKAIVIVQGDTDSGKTTLINAIKEVLGTYAASLHAENFLQQQNPNKKWELANADHARFVPIEEIGTEGRVFAIDFLKAASGGGDMTGEKKNQQPYTFRPQWKLLFLCNDIPSAPAGDNATWKRLHLIECAPAPAVLDRTLGAHLATSTARSAILAWMVAGAADFLAQGGIHAPEAIRAATRRHRGDCDWLSKFLEEHYTLGTDEDHISSREFMADLQLWCRQNGHRDPSAVSVLRRLKRYGIEAEGWIYDQDTKKSVRAWKGLRKYVDEMPRWSVAIQAIRGETEANASTASINGSAVSPHFASPHLEKDCANLERDPIGFRHPLSSQPPADQSLHDFNRGEATNRGETEANATHDQNKPLHDFASLASVPRAGAHARACSHDTSPSLSPGGGSSGTPSEASDADESDADERAEAALRAAERAAIQADSQTSQTLAALRQEFDARPTPPL